MSARGILSNPALFAGHQSVPAQCVSDYVNLALEYDGVPFALHHYHLMCMLLTRSSAADRAIFHRLSSLTACADYLRARDMWTPSPFLEQQRRRVMADAGVACIVDTELQTALSPLPAPSSIGDPFAGLLNNEALDW